MLKRIKGDLIKLAKNGEFDVIVHGCNCFCIMGSGIARQIKEQYPEAYEADCATIKGDKSKLGDFTFADTDDGFIIVNAYTQYDFNRAGETVDHFDYDAFESVLNALSEDMGDLRFGFPYIGMGLAGGNKEKILELLEKFSLDVEDQGGVATLVEYRV